MCGIAPQWQGSSPGDPSASDVLGPDRASILSLLGVLVIVVIEIEIVFVVIVVAVVIALALVLPIALVIALPIALALAIAALSAVSDRQPDRAGPPKHCRMTPMVRRERSCRGSLSVTAITPSDAPPNAGSRLLAVWRDLHARRATDSSPEIANH